MDKRIVILGALLFVFLALALSSTLYYRERCANFGCFYNSMRECDRVTYINDANEATWKYEIKGLENNECVIEVKLLQSSKA